MPSRIANFGEDSVYHPSVEIQASPILQRCWRIDKLKGTGRGQSGLVVDSLCCLRATREGYSVKKHRMLHNSVATSELTCELPQVRRLRHSNRNHAARVNGCMLHTWSAEQYSCILGRRLLYSCTWPAITTHHLTRQALRARVDLVGLHVLHFTLHKPLTSHTFTRTRHCRHGLASSLRLAPTACTQAPGICCQQKWLRRNRHQRRFLHMHILPDTLWGNNMNEPHKCQHCGATT